MHFEWDDEKNRLNQTKHDLSFEEAAQIFHYPTLTCVDDRTDYGEQREITIGQLNAQVVIVMIHTNRNNVIRIISARRANRAERKVYNDYYQKISR